MDGWMGFGWMVIIGHRSSKSTFGANDRDLRLPWVSIGNDFPSIEFENRVWSVYRLLWGVELSYCGGRMGCSWEEIYNLFMLGTTPTGGGGQNWIFEIMRTKGLHKWYEISVIGQNFYPILTSTQIREKVNFFTLRPPAQKRREISGWVRRMKWCLHTGQQMSCWQQVAAGPFWPCFACPKLGDAGKTRVASKNREV